MASLCNAASAGFINEDAADYQFIQRVVTELTQSCALPLPFPQDAIPPLILQAAQFFWENDDNALTQKYYALPYSEICKNGPNKTVILPCQIIAVDGVHKLGDAFNFGSVMGDFSLERMVINNSALAAGVGGSMSDFFGSGSGYNLQDIMVALYEVQTYKQMFGFPVSYNFSPYSNELSLLGDIKGQNLLLQCWVRCRIQELYRSYYFFRMVVCLAKRAMSQVMGTYSFKMPGGVSINYDNFRSDAQDEIRQIEEYLVKQHSPDYIFMPNTI